MWMFSCMYVHELLAFLMLAEVRRGPLACLVTDNMNQPCEYSDHIYAL